MANKRLYYAVLQAGVSECGANSFTSIHGLQSLGLSTRFNLEQFFEIGQLAIYENVEGIPDIEVTTEKLIDGYPPVYLLATKGAATASLSGRSAVKATMGVSFYSDVQDSASGTPISQCTMSGVYVSSLTYQIQVQGAATEQLTLVGNNKIWSNTFSASAFTNTDAPLAISGSGGVQDRNDILFGPSDTNNPSKCLLPIDIQGLTASGTNEQAAGGDYGCHLNSIRVSTNLGRESLFELGRRGPYHRFVSFPTEVRSDFEVTATDGDKVSADEESLNNTADRKIFLIFRDGLRLDLGTKNRLQQITSGGANAGTQGGNMTHTYSYVNFNDLGVRHPQDPTTALRP